MSNRITRLLAVLLGFALVVSAGGSDSADAAPAATTDGIAMICRAVWTPPCCAVQCDECGIPYGSFTMCEHKEASLISPVSLPALGAARVPMVSHGGHVC